MAGTDSDGSDAEIPAWFRLRWAVSTVLIHAFFPPNAPLLYGLAGGGLAFLGALLYSGEVPKEFYATCAQIAPVFLVALIVEQRLADQFASAEKWEKDAEMAWQEARNLQSSEGDYVYWIQRWPDHEYVAGIKDAVKMRFRAREEFRAKQGAYAVKILMPVVALSVAQVCAIVGITQGATTSANVCFILTAAALAASFFLIVTSAVPELMRAWIDAPSTF
jgi:hypothetical protein